MSRRRPRLTSGNIAAPPPSSSLSLRPRHSSRTARPGPRSATARQAARGRRPADLAGGVLALINAHRGTVGAPALVTSTSLTAAAVWKARHMAMYRVHGARRPGAAGRALHARSNRRLRLRGRRLGREHRLRLPDAAGGGRRLARFAGASRQHRAARLSSRRASEPRSRRTAPSTGRRHSGPDGRLTAAAPASHDHDHDDDHDDSRAASSAPSARRAAAAPCQADAVSCAPRPSREVTRPPLATPRPPLHPALPCCRDERDDARAGHVQRAGPTPHRPCAGRGSPPRLRAVHLRRPTAHSWPPRLGHRSGQVGVGCRAPVVLAPRALLSRASGS